MRALSELRYACRSLWQHPGFALISIVSVALGVGLNAAMFSYVDAMLLRPIPARDSARIVQINSTSPDRRLGGVPYPDYADLRDQSRTMSSLVCYDLEPLGVSASRKALPQMTLGVLASGNYFSGLGIDLPVGRGFRDEEDATGSDLVAVIGHSFWERQFGSDPNVAGKKVRVNGAEFTVIGVAPADFNGLDSFVLPDVYIPIHAFRQAVPNLPNDYLTARDRRTCSVYGRVKSGGSEGQAQAELAAVAQRLAQRYPETNKSRT